MLSLFLKSIHKTIIVLILLIMSVESVPAQDTMVIGAFSDSIPGNELPDFWEPLTFKKINRHTRYSVVDDSGKSIIKAESHNAASGMIRKIRIDPQKYPVVKWRWKVTNVYKKGDVFKKDGDDYPACIYIAFEYMPKNTGFFKRMKYQAAKLVYGRQLPVSAIAYIWESNAPVGTIVPNPHTDSVMMIVVESGTKNLNTWVEEERNIYDDYRKAFGDDSAADVPLISGVAIMTDTDNTGETATSFYGDIVFKSER